MLAKPLPHGAIFYPSADLNRPFSAAYLGRDTVPAGERRHREGERPSTSVSLLDFRDPQTLGETAYDLEYEDYQYPPSPLLAGNMSDACLWWLMEEDGWRACVAHVNYEKAM